MIKILGIETSCDETAAAVVGRDSVGAGTVLSSVVRAQWDQHRAFGGVVPELAARAHVECLDTIIAQAVAEAGVSLGDLDGVAVTAGPGLIGGLMVGVVTAGVLAQVHGLPLIAINHLEAHALTVGITEGLRPPYLLLLVSGGHTQILAVQGIGRYVRLGRRSTTRWARRSTRRRSCSGSVYRVGRRWSGRRRLDERDGSRCRDRCMAGRSRISRSRV